ncbi:SRPBCC domain-containing protein [Hanamia caeni]|uniref:SRPBCC domain-containing protein n=1 Tax=Hanamia caeni TaxID=2294116 RepID=A0A3M9NAK3_9BACT|nr:SRPBCC domain-containing protein [Hanamia caeni]RNI34814.1 SRPBCC domain-containing protein [Hanamia caeni]
MPQDDYLVLLDITFKTSIENVWEAWTNPVWLMKWFGSDPKGKVLKAEVNVRPGGYFTITFQDADLTEHTCFGVYDEVEALRKLAFSWQWESEAGVESFITLLLTPAKKFTTMQFEHKNFGSASKHDYEKGWQSTFLKLERLLEHQN